MMVFKALLLCVLALVSVQAFFFAPIPTLAPPKAAITMQLGTGTTLERPQTVIAKPTFGVESSSEEEVKVGGRYKLMLFNDNGNTREYVARCLVSVVGMSESDAYDIMTQAHKNGMAVVGMWHLELAEAYNEELGSKGIISEVVPVDD
ncbi:unnamed protein product [Chrysoparadoxa australica]